ncbi:hypothetical protein E2C01_042243 [Portunus trituberculatus]|uniref:Uncharacterized protein n=1 Tax=Portunus trituberculatus TaxID=210409 RepID=A0A5B7FLA0_PORTR|nr:hypothetical protein [Portunus trituberculatus]
MGVWCRGYEVVAGVVGEASPAAAAAAVAAVVASRVGKALTLLETLSIKLRNNYITVHLVSAATSKCAFQFSRPKFIKEEDKLERLQRATALILSLKTSDC